MLYTAGEGGNIAAEQYAFSRGQRAVSSTDQRCSAFHDAAIHLHSTAGKVIERLKQLLMQKQGIAAVLLQWQDLPWSAESSRLERGP